MLRFEPALRLQNPVVLPTVPREPLEILTNVSERLKIFGTRDSNPDRLLEKLLSEPQSRDLFLNKKSWQKY